MSIREVFILDHWIELENGDEIVKTIGMYSTESKAWRAADRMKLLPGFCDHPDEFHVERYILGEDHWVEGFFTAGN
ncbi:hypothetical protein ACFVMC_32380 [Nocardia sp. NPDC127579]|uniref:DUF7336 domain-containing protein n=1 Tax=Nocardia sp. NPDC127579 TaxID=3345402 RepID=UPI0036339083